MDLLCAKGVYGTEYILLYIAANTKAFTVQWYFSIYNIQGSWGLCKSIRCDAVTQKSGLNWFVKNKTVLLESFCLNMPIKL